MKQSTAKPVRARDVVAALIKFPGLIGPTLRTAVRSAVEGVRSDGDLPWLVQASRIRRAIPDAAIGVNWSGDEAFVEALLPHIDSASRVLEIGCGGGRIARLVAPKVGELVCSDVSELMLKEARAGLKGHDNIQFSVASGLGLDRFPDASFDAVYAHDVLVTFDPNEIFAVLDASRRVLRARGTLAASFYTIDRPEWRRLQLDQVRKSVKLGRFGPSIPRPYTAPQIEAWFEATGFTLVDGGYNGGHANEPERHYIAVGRAETPTTEPGQGPLKPSPSSP